MEQGESSSTFPVFPVTYQPYHFIIKISDFCLDNWATIIYDIPGRGDDNFKNREASDEVYEYISCNLCLVKLEDPGLVYTGEKFEHKDRRWQIGMLVHGFIFPSFEDRTSDIHNITVFNKKSDGAFDDFDQEILGLRPVASADMQKQSFTAALVEELKADMDEKPMKATNIVDKRLQRSKLLMWRLKLM